MPGLVIVGPPEAGVATITLNRPEKRNALSIAVRDAVSDALDRLAIDEGCKVVVVTGAGGVFSAGFDLREFEQPELADELWASSDRFHRTWLEFPLPTVAAVNGPALAGGFDLAVMCDVRVAADAARFSHPELAFGDVVYGPLHDLVGGSVARDLCLTGRVLEAGEALRLGFLSAVVPGDELLAQAMETAGAIARAPREVLVRTKAKFIRRARVVGGNTLDL
ncbi:MAG TPA: enoyl-CoA hydratase/isomerase family protein [Acidimicrobiales bacterium]|nr:enoyl-CoA hydratase/isomerase family protein [Acidimicrobiales bacterium]